jgi:N-ethylmaleimide reductase
MQLKNKIVMAPMTRCRATADHIPTELMATYYKQRANAGLIITEGTSPSANGLGYARIPGLFTQEHASAWRKITEAVHETGCHIFVQLMHTGRVSHTLNMPTNSRVLAPSAIKLEETMWTDEEGALPNSQPQAMTQSDIEQAIREYSDSAALAIEAGFDGVELHAANGYLIDQFLNTASNQRTDQWGGSIENRARFAIEVAKAVTDRIGAAHTGIRLSPYGAFNSMQPDDEMDSLYIYLANELSKLKLAYIHIVDHSAMGAPEVPDSVKSAIRDNFNGSIILSGGYDRDRANTDLDANKGDLVAFGRPYLSNPDLARRLKEGSPMAEADMDTFYSPGEQGYTDYAPLS